MPFTKKSSSSRRKDRWLRYGASHLQRGLGAQIRSSPLYKIWWSKRRNNPQRTPRVLEVHYLVTIIFTNVDRQNFFDNKLGSTRKFKSGKN
mmetsp:Transcript_50835/g.99419  ORF Transcript_50835/g.99419 Transcript_50835/m.99419 type:complete len:91 (-) Transcript_50835:53-325(-)